MNIERLSVYIDRPTLDKYLQYQNHRVLAGDWVSILTPTNKVTYLTNVFTNYLNQQYRNKELIILLNSNQLKLYDWINYAKAFDNVRVYQLDETITLGECLNYGITEAKGRYLARFDDDDYYGPHYLSDAVSCFNRTEAFVVGKLSHFIYVENLRRLYISHQGTNYTYTTFLTGATHVYKREIFDTIRFQHVSLGEDSQLIDDCNGLGYRFYNADPFNYVTVRRTDKNQHTWKVDDDLYLTSCNATPVADAENFSPYVMVDP